VQLAVELGIPQLLDLDFVAKLSPEMLATLRIYPQWKASMQ
jgi:hypothetical protein